MPATSSALACVRGKARRPAPAPRGGLSSRLLKLRALTVEALLHPVEVGRALVDFAGFLIDPLLSLGQPGLPALQVAAEVLDLFLDRPDLVLDLVPVLGGLLRGLLGPADDGRERQTRRGPGAAPPPRRPPPVPAARRKFLRRRCSSCGVAATGRRLAVSFRCRGPASWQEHRGVRERAQIARQRGRSPAPARFRYSRFAPSRSRARRHRRPALRHALQRGATRLRTTVEGDGPG